MSRDIYRERARRVASWPSLIHEHRQTVRRMEQIAAGCIVVVDEDEGKKREPREIEEDAE